jgi:hypothetical protein
MIIIDSFDKPPIMKLLTVLTGCLCIAGLTANAQTTIKHRVLGQDKGHIVILGTDGKIEWETPCTYSNHDISMLPNGDVLFASNATTVTEISPDQKVVWQYHSTPKEGYAGRVEVHAIQRLANGNTMISENGNSRFIEVDKDGKIIKALPYTIQNHDAHSETRLARLLDNGHYIACHEHDGTVREYDESGKVVWSYKLDLNNQEPVAGHKGHGTDVYHAVRLNNGNTLIAGGSNYRILEVN